MISLQVTLTFIINKVRKINHCCQKKDCYILFYPCVSVCPSVVLSVCLFVTKIYVAFFSLLFNALFVISVENNIFVKNKPSMKIAAYIALNIAIRLMACSDLEPSQCEGRSRSLYNQF